MSATATKSNSRGGLLAILAKLHSIQLTGGKQQRLPRKKLGEVFSNLATLLENGVTLPKALSTIAQEKSMRWCRSLLNSLHAAIESGDSFSKALGKELGESEEILVQQIRVGERSGTVPQVLRRIATNLESENELRGKVIKKLSYPIIVTVAGTGVCAFMILFILPVFEETYSKAKIPLPLPTKILVGTGEFMTGYGWMFLVALVGLWLLIKQLRGQHDFAVAMDRWLVRLPLVGPWLCDVAMLQFMDTLGTMLESGFHVADALAQCRGTISNKAVDQAIASLGSAVRRGERLSREMERHNQLFPPLVSQLVIVGEQTGKLDSASRQVRDFLRRDIERKTEAFVRVVEPVMTIAMAFLVGGILLSIYLPMFGMLDMVDK